MERHVNEGKTAWFRVGRVGRVVVSSA
jgi:hypothetical protein